jgi:hypothetical protein
MARAVIYHTPPARSLEGRVSTFEGKRTIDGLVVTVDGRRLDEHYDVKRYTSWGFEWTYEGDSPQQLALAILMEHLRDKARAVDLCGAFMRKVVANLDNDWVLSGTEIDQAIADLQAGRENTARAPTARK